MREKDSLEFLLQRSMRHSGIHTLIFQPWLVVYENIRNKKQDDGIFCALIHNDAVNKCMEHPSWDLFIGNGLPGHIVRYEDGREITEYHRFGNSERLEPLVFLRRYHGIQPSHLEISEEFRHFHNAYWDPIKKVLNKSEMDGSENIIGRVCDSRLELRLLEVRQFLAAKQMYLAIYFDFRRFSEVDPQTIPAEERDIELKKDLLCFTFHASSWDGEPDETRSFSRLKGKILLPPPLVQESGIWPFDEKDESFPEFIIGTDTNGGARTYCSDPKGLANYFGANPQAPSYLTPVFFRREVLGKYYANPQKYSVEDGYLRCGELWGLRMDNNLPDYVMVYLGDLGQDLPDKERLYWKTFNVTPDGRMSTVNFRRDFLCEFSDPVSPDLFFKELLSCIGEQWLKRFGWNLFLPLAEADAHYLTTLRVPLTDDQAEFDPQVLSIAKLLIDSLNEKQIEAELDHSIPSEKGIGKLERLLEKHSIPRWEDHIVFLRDLQTLRSTGVAHRKGSNYKRVLARLQTGQQSYPDIFRTLLGQAINFLQALGVFLEEPKEKME